MVAGYRRRRARALPLTGHEEPSLALRVSGITNTPVTSLKAWRRKEPSRLAMPWPIEGPIREVFWLLLPVLLGICRTTLSDGVVVAFDLHKFDLTTTARRHDERVDG